MPRENQLNSFPIKIVHCTAKTLIQQWVVELVLLQIAPVAQLIWHLLPPLSFWSQFTCLRHWNFPIPFSIHPTMLFYISGNKYTFDKIIEKAGEQSEMAHSWHLAICPKFLRGVGNWNFGNSLARWETLRHFISCNKLIIALSRADCL